LFWRKERGETVHVLNGQSRWLMLFDLARLTEMTRKNSHPSFAVRDVILSRWMGKNGVNMPKKLIQPKHAKLNSAEERIPRHNGRCSIPASKICCRAFVSVAYVRI